MSKKINLNNMNTSILSILSQYHIAYMAICEYSRQKKEALKKVEAEIEKYKSENKPELEDGSINPDYSLSKFEKEIGRITTWYEGVTAPLKEQQKPALKLVDSDCYYAYAVSMLKGSLSSTGTIEIPSKKGKTSFTVKKSYLQQVRKFLMDMGIDASNDTALDKCAKSLALRCGGMLKDNSGNYLKLRNQSGFNQIMILAFLQYAIVDRRSLIIKADNSLAINLGSTEA